MITVKKANGETVVLGTDQEKLLMSILDYAIGTKFDDDVVRLELLKKTIDYYEPVPKLDQI